MTKTPFLSWDFNYIHHSLSNTLVILRLGHSLGCQDVVTGLEFGVEHLIREAHAADGNTSEHTVALVLMHHEIGLNSSVALVSVGHNTTDEVGIGLVQDIHQVVELTLEVRGYGLATTFLLPSSIILGCFEWLTGVILEAFNKELVASILHHLNNSVVEGILVLLEPISQIVGHGGGIMDDGKMRIGIGSGIGLGEVGPFSEQVRMKLLTEGLISCLGEKRFFLKDGQKTHRLFKHVNTFLQIHAKVTTSPFKTFFDVFLLFKHEHVVVEKLLELLVNIVNTDLLKAVVIKDLKTGNIKDSNVGDFLHGRINQGLITLVGDEAESAFIDGTSDTSNGVGCTHASGTLDHPFSSDLQLRLAEIGDHPFAVNASKIGNLLTIGFILDVSLLFFAHGNKVLGHVAHVHHAGSVLVHIVFLLLGESEHMESLFSKLHVFFVIDGGNGEFSLGDIPVVKDVIGKKTLGLDGGD